MTNKSAQQRKISCPGAGLRVITVLFFMIFNHCSRDESVASSANVTTTTTTTGKTTSLVIGGNFTEIDLSSNTITIDAEVGDDESVVLMLVGTNTNGQTEGFTINGSVNTEESSSSAFSQITNTTTFSENTATEDAHKLLRTLEQEIPSNTPTPKNETQNMALTSTSAQQQKNFKVITTFDTAATYTTVTANLTYSGKYFNLYLDARDADAFQNSDDFTLAQQFEEMIPYERQIFGSEADVNGDGKFDVLITREVNALGQKYGGLVTGYFIATDEFDASVYSSSNEQEIFYMIRPDDNGSFGPSVPYDLAVQNILPGVLAHEYQHMISFNQHYFKHHSAAEASWLNEGLSHLAEDIYSIKDNLPEDTDPTATETDLATLYMSYTGLENPSRVYRYLKNVDQTCFSCGSSLEQRGGTYLFLRYIYEQMELDHDGGGTEFLQNLLEGTYRDSQNLANALSGSPNNTQVFDDALAQFGATLYVSGTSQSPGEEYEITGINLRSVQSDNRGTVLNGPAIMTLSDFPKTGSLNGRSIGYVQISGQTINDAGGSFTLQLADSNAFRVFLIQ